MKIEFGFFFLIFNIFIMKIMKSVNHEHGENHYRFNSRTENMERRGNDVCSVEIPFI